MKYDLRTCWLTPQVKKQYRTHQYIKWVIMAGNFTIKIVGAVALGGDILLPQQYSFFKVEVDAQGVAEEEECGDPDHGVHLASLQVELPLPTFWHHD